MKKELEINDQTEATLIAMMDEQVEANEGARKAAEPFYEKSNALSGEIRALQLLITETFREQLRKLARASSKAEVRSVWLDRQPTSKSITVSYYVGRKYNHCLLSTLLDKGEYESVLKRLEAEKLQNARDSVAAAEAMAAHSRDKLAKLKSKHG